MFYYNRQSELFLVPNLLIRPFIVLLANTGLLKVMKQVIQDQDLHYVTAESGLTLEGCHAHIRHLRDIFIK